MGVCVWYYSPRLLTRWLAELMNEKVALTLGVVLGLLITLGISFGSLILIFNVFSRGPLVTKARRCKSLWERFGSRMIKDVIANIVRIRLLDRCPRRGPVR